MKLNRSNDSGEKENGIPILGNPSKFFGQAIVSFVDLLGFSRSVLKEWEDSVNSPLNRLLRIKSSPTIKNGRQLSVGSYSLQDGQTIRDSLYRAKVHAFSDSMILSVALPQELTIGDFVLAFSNVALNLRFIWHAAVEEGFVVRGAIEIGQIYWDSSEILGPVLIETYGLESTITKSARIILGPRITRTLIEVIRRDQYDWASFLVKCNDGMIALSPIGAMKQEGSDPKKVIQKIKMIQKNCSDNALLSSKYDELLSMLENPGECHVPTIEDLENYAIGLEKRVKELL